METIRLSATEARNGFFSLLNKVIYSGVNIIIDKADAPSAVEIRRVPGMEESDKVKKALSALEELREIYGKVPEAKFRERENFFRGKKEKEYMEKLVGDRS